MTAPSAIATDRALDAELFVVVVCHAFPCALSSRWIVRLLLPDEVRVRDAGVIEVEDRLFAAWNLGEMLGLDPLGDAWILLDVPHDGASVPIALQTGACLAAQPLTTRFPLPSGLFHARRGALGAAFVAKEVGAGQFGLVGLYFDAARAWTREELDRSKSAVSFRMDLERPPRAKGPGRS